MRILLATFWKIPHLGGVDTYMTLLKESLEKQGHQVDILAHNPNFESLYLISKDPSKNGNAVAKLQIVDFVFYAIEEYFQKHLPHVDPWVYWQELERYTFELAASLFDLDQYDMIHTQDIISTRAISRVKPPHVPLFATIHGLLAKEFLLDEDIYSENRKFARKWWNYVALKEHLGVTSADQVIIPSVWLANEFSGDEFRVPVQSIHIIPYGMDVSDFVKRMQRKTSPAVRKKANKFVITCPARLVRQKDMKHS